MKITRKFDRAFQWAGEKMGSEAKTSHSDEFKTLETEMALRIDGMSKLQTSMNAYAKWAGRKGETFEDKEKGLPGSYLGRTMVAHGEDFEPDSEYGNCLITMGRTNERLASIQEQYVADATAAWLDNLNRSMAMMKEYTAARKKLESRRLAYDASVTKVQKSKREDYRLEEDVRSCRAKFEESNEDVLRRMQDIKENETDCLEGLSSFLDIQLEFHERCVEELRRAREQWPAAGSPGAAGGRLPPPSRQRSVASFSVSDRASNRQDSYNSRPDAYSRQGSYSDRSLRNDVYSERTCRNDVYEEPEPIRSTPYRSRPAPPAPPSPPSSRPAIGARSVTTPTERRISGPNQPLGNMMRNNLRPVHPINTSMQDDVFADRDDDDTPDSSRGSPEWGDRCASPATSNSSYGRPTPTSGMRKAPPPPPPSRAKKPAPPLPPKRNTELYN